MQEPAQKKFGSSLAFIYSWQRQINVTS